ncbi:hypothetical protein [Nostoc sp. LPT]|uniref:hypothetical protein n=1 Tax=Nostoc sp. LPT TaxID=2815387 RepID=UPI001E0167B8|nr:hypothetical protein [Nostoc sp. LPT]MBN4005825.1 hypothetical protein [Nostoc sp. LPT]
MTSLVFELQKDACESSVSVLNLLRKALVVANYTIENYISMSQTYNSMSDNHSTNIQAGRDASGNLLGSEVTGIVAGGNISDTVNNAINQLQASNTSEVLQLAELLV